MHPRAIKVASTDATIALSPRTASSRTDAASQGVDSLLEGMGHGSGRSLYYHPYILRAEAGRQEELRYL